MAYKHPNKMYMNLLTNLNLIILDVLKGNSIKKKSLMQDNYYTLFDQSNWSTVVGFFLGLVFAL